MIYPFVENPKGNPKTGKQYEIYEYYRNGGKYSKEMKEIHCMGGYSPNTISLIYHGFVRVSGWTYDYRDIFNKYLVNLKNYGWIECYGPCKMFIRDYFGSHNILKIIKID